MVEQFANLVKSITKELQRPMKSGTDTDKNGPKAFNDAVMVTVAVGEK
jgi:hypothetical protein